MEEKPKWRWPTKRFQQVLLVLDGLVLLAWVRELADLFLGDGVVWFRYSSPPRLDSPISNAIMALAYSIFAAQRRSWFWVGASFVGWGATLKYVTGYVPVDRRFPLEVLVVLMYGVGAVLWGVSILRGELDKAKADAPSG